MPTTGFLTCKIADVPVQVVTLGATNSGNVGAGFKVKTISVLALIQPVAELAATK